MDIFTSIAEWIVGEFRDHPVAFLALILFLGYHAVKRLLAWSKKKDLTDSDQQEKINAIYNYLFGDPQIPNDQGAQHRQREMEKDIWEIKKKLSKHI